MEEGEDRRCNCNFGPPGGPLRDGKLYRCDVFCMPSNEERSIDEKSMEAWNFDTKKSNISSRKLIRGVEETVPLKIVFVLSGYLERLPRYEGSKCG